MLKKALLSALLSKNAEHAILNVSPTIAPESFLFYLILREQNCRDDGEFPVKKRHSEPSFFVRVVRVSSKLLRICGVGRAPLQRDLHSRTEPAGINC
jgi:hypothetical protein